MKAFLLIVFVYLLTACFAYDQPAPALTESEASELAVLMRGIHSDAKGWKASILKGNLPTGKTDVYEALISSTPTKPEVKGPTYEAMAQNYQTALDSLFASRNIDLAKSRYNNLVQACLTCHASYCPGPTSTIKKLRLAIE